MQGDICDCRQMLAFTSLNIPRTQKAKENFCREFFRRGGAAQEGGVLWLDPLAVLPHAAMWRWKSGSPARAPHQSGGRSGARESDWSSVSRLGQHFVFP